MIGINTDSDKSEYIEKAKAHKVNWRDAWQGGPGGPIPAEWGITMYPTNFVLDADGRIRARNVHGDKLERLVSKLIAEVERESGE